MIGLNISLICEKLTLTQTIDYQFYGYRVRLRGGFCQPIHEMLNPVHATKKLVFLQRC